jgi:hypothetical protein
MLCLSKSTKMLSSVSSHINVIVAQCDLFDFSRGEPPSSFVTVLRVLDVRFNVFYLLASFNSV